MEDQSISGFASSGTLAERIPTQGLPYDAYGEAPLSEGQRYLELSEYAQLMQAVEESSLRHKDESRRQNILLARELRTDMLTGAGNRKLLQEELEVLVAGQPGNFGVAFIDLDGLKQVNDQFGHEAGDSYIKSAVLGLLRASDKVFRLGGDEIVVLVDLQDETQEAGVRGAGTIDERLGNIVQHLQNSMETMSAEGRPVKGSIAGVAHEPGQSAEAVVMAADARMYEQKQQRKLELFRALSPEDQQVLREVAYKLSIVGMTAREAASIIDALPPELLEQPASPAQAAASIMVASTVQAHFGIPAPRR
jgi:diguanylate cyclase (GGDEF)-like protein